MSRKATALKAMLVALGHGSSVSAYAGTSVSDVLKELAVILQCAPSTASIRTNNIAELFTYIANNYGTETKEPFDLSITGDDHVTLAVKVNGTTTTAGVDKLYNGDKVNITATAGEGYHVKTLTLNGTTITSGTTHTVNGAAMTIVSTSEVDE